MKIKLKLFALVLALTPISFAVAEVQTCGLAGRIHERIENCNFSVSKFKLVTRDETGKSVYYHAETMLLWGPISENSVSIPDGGPELCAMNPLVSNGLEKLDWRLPFREFTQAQELDSEGFLEISKDAKMLLTASQSKPHGKIGDLYNIEADNFELAWFPIEGQYRCISKYTEL